MVNIKNNLFSETSIINSIVMKILTAVSFALIVGYFIEVAKGTRSINYVLMLSSVILVGLIIDFIFYLKNKTSKKNPYIFLCSYLITYGIPLFTN